jgi:hypothetical protein
MLGKSFYNIPILHIIMLLVSDGKHYNNFIIVITNKYFFKL